MSAWHPLPSSERNEIPMTFGDNPTDRFTIRSCKCSGKIDSPQLLGFSASTVSPETTWQFIHSTSIPACRNTREASSSAPRIVPHGTATSLCTEIVTTMGVFGTTLAFTGTPAIASTRPNPIHFLRLLPLTALTSTVSPKIGQGRKYLNAGGIARFAITGNGLTQAASNG